MAQRTYEFRPPVWRPRTHLHTQTAALILGTAVWLALGVFLGWQIWHSPRPLTREILITTAITTVWSVGMGLAWQHMLHRWRRTIHHRVWPPLNLEQMLALSPTDFEEYVAYRLFRRQGYHVDNPPTVKDGGIDLIITDSRGRRAVAQCKRYRGTVGESILRDLYGTMIHDGAGMGFLITTGTISASARRWAEGKPLVLIDGARLVELAHAEPRPHGSYL